MRTKKRFLSLLLVGAMLFSGLPATAFAENGNDSGQTAGGFCEHHLQHTDGCGYTEVAPCTFVCDICSLQDKVNWTEGPRADGLGHSGANSLGSVSGNTIPVPKEPEKCVCETLCTEDNINPDCPVCVEDFSGCEGESPAIMPMANDATSGNFNNGLSWWRSGFTLIFDGNGGIPDFDPGTAPWESFKSQIESIDFRGTVTSIGNNAFNGCSSLSAVAGEGVYTVTSIGDSAFEGCGSLPNISTSSVTTIGNSAFKGCGSLTNISLPLTLTAIGDSAFEDCSSLSEPITIPSSVTTIGDSAFKGCSSLTTIDLPDSLTTIETSTFEGCSGLTEISLPSSLTTIEASAFKGCSGLTGVLIGSDNRITIGVSAFEGCSSLRDFSQDALPSTILRTVTNIGDSAFKGCSSLTTMTFSSGSLPTIGEEIFEDCDGLYAIIIESNENLSENWKPYEEKIFRNGMPQKLTLEVSLAGSGTFTVAAGNGKVYQHTDNTFYVEANRTVTLTAAPAEGYHFLKWTDTNTKDQVSASASHSLTLYNETSLTAEFCQKSLTYHAAAGTCGEEGTIEYWSCSNCGKNFADAAATTPVENISVGILPHSWGDPSWEWNGDYTQATATFTCARDRNHKETVYDNSPTSTIDTAAACATDGQRTHKATVELDGKTYTNEQRETIPATGHRYPATPVWTWGDNYETATATLTCEYDSSHILTATDNELETSITAATCTEDGTTTYTAEVTLDGTTYTKSSDPVKTSDALGHAWGDPTWTWADDYKSATAEFTCTRDDSHTAQEIDNNLTVTENTPATCTEDGKTVYEAKVTLDGKEYTGTGTQTLNKLNHDWGEWVPGNDGHHTRTCKRDSGHTEQGDCNAVAGTPCTACGYKLISITVHPLAQEVIEGETATFTVTAEGSNITSYQWQVSADNGNTWTNVGEAGKENKGFTTPTATMEMNGYQYRVVVANEQNDADSVTSSAAKLTVSKKQTPVDPGEGDGDHGGSTDPDEGGTDTGEGGSGGNAGGGSGSEGGSSDSGNSGGNTGGDSGSGGGATSPGDETASAGEAGASQKVKKLTAPKKVTVSPSYNKVKVSWKKVAGATGYQVYRTARKNGKYKKVKTTKARTWTNKKLKTGKTWYYKVRAYKKEKGKTVYSKFSARKKAKVRPAAPTLKVRAAKGAITARWSPVAGATRYQLYRASKKNGKYYRWRETVKRGYVDRKKLHKGKTCYYKVRAYRVVNGKKIYGKFSEVKKVRAK